MNTPPDPPFPPYNGDRYDVTASVGHQLYLLMNLMRRDIQSRMSQEGLTEAQWRPLWLLKNGRADSLMSLAREMCMDAGAMTRLIDRLETKDLVTRVRSEADRRLIHLRLTAHGEAVVAHVPHVLAAVNNDFLAGFSEADWLQLRSLIGRMNSNGQALQQDKSTP
ncbi:MAG: MarR family winged helix-turn-helix transcriptional regulator [Leptothrix ochracea]|uniref:MarR family winged helix-turn-helix transcriptional regulator n=1 Tax=Leptothrix ochracea TaxID=735331 RepID=UPI0034E21C41